MAPLISSGAYTDLTFKNCRLTSDTTSLFDVTSTGTCNVHLYGDTQFYSVGTGKFITAGATATGNVYAHDLGVTFDNNFAGGTANRVNLYYAPGVTVASTVVAYVKRQLGWEALSPSAIAANVNNYAPTGWKDARFVRLSSTAQWAISGFSATTDQPFKWLINTSGSTIILKHLSGLSSAVNQILTYTSEDIKLRANGGLFIYYDTANSKWRTLDLEPQQEGDVVGPAIAYDDAIARYDGTTGKLLKGSIVRVEDDGDITGALSTRYKKRLTAPLAQQDTGAVYVKKVGDYTELFYLDEDSNDIQLTSMGAIVPGTGSGPDTRGGGWVRVVDIQMQGAGAVYDQVYNDTAQTIIQNTKASNEFVQLTIECCYPNVEIVPTFYELTRVGDIYRGTVNLTVAPTGVTNIIVQSVDSDGIDGAFDSVDIEVVPPPTILTLAFADQSGGAGGSGTYPGSQTELKAGDTIRVEGTTDSNADAIQCDDVGACGRADRYFCVGHVL